MLCSTHFALCGRCIKHGVEILTVYAFSTENWARPSEEVKFLLNFNEKILLERRDELNERNVRIRFIGRRNRQVPRRLIRRMEETENLTKGNTGLTFTIAFNYGGRAEIVDAVKRIIDKGMSAERINEKTINWYDDDLLEKFLMEEEISIDELKNSIRKSTIDNKVVPVLCGTALKNKCVQPLLDAIGDYLPSPLDVPSVEGVKPGTEEVIARNADNKAPFSALAFKTVTDPYIGRLVYFRVYSGSAKSGSSVLNTVTGDRERLGRIVKMHADQREDIEEVFAGEIAAAIGLKDTSTGETICSIEEPILLEKIEFPDPVVSVSVEPKSRADQDKLSDALVKLSDEDPTFTIKYDDETGQTVMSGMGELHLEILTDRMKREFSVEANIGKPRVAFRETIRKNTTAEGKFVRQSGGHGQYGHVIIEMEPRERGEGVLFENKIKGGAIPTEYISSVEDGVRKALNNGPKSGFPVIDLLVTLIDGSYHDVDSSKVSFEVAGSMAAKTAVTKCSPVVLEPVMKLEVVTPEDYLGDVVGDLGRRRAAIETIDAQGDTQIVKASLPLAESFGYANDLRSISQGRAGYSMEFDKYLEAPESVVASQEPSTR